MYLHWPEVPSVESSSSQNFSAEAKEENEKGNERSGANNDSQRLLAHQVKADRTTYSGLRFGVNSGQSSNWKSPFFARVGNGAAVPSQ